MYSKLPPNTFISPEISPRVFISPQVARDGPTMLKAWSILLES